MLNKVIITGRLVADPELRYTPSNKAVATARIALHVILKIKTENERPILLTSSFGVNMQRISQLGSRRDIL